jgi:hypothetical protein
LPTYSATYTLRSPSAFAAIDWLELIIWTLLITMGSALAIKDSQVTARQAAHALKLPEHQVQRLRQQSRR